MKILVTGISCSGRKTLQQTFADYCREELERLRDSGGAFDEEEFRAAVDLAIGRLEALENEEKA